MSSQGAGLFRAAFTGKGSPLGRCWSTPNEFVWEAVGAIRASVEKAKK